MTSQLKDLVDAFIIKYDYLKLPLRDVHDLVLHDLKHVGLTEAEYTEVVKYLNSKVKERLNENTN